MTAQPTPSYTGLAIAIIIAAALVSATLYAAVGQGERTITSTTTSTYFLATASFQTTTQLSTIISTSTTTSTVTSMYNPFLSPELQVELNGTTIRQGGALTAVITIFNPLPENLSVAPDYSSNSTIAHWNEYDFWCDGSAMWSLAGYALFQGHYSSENISSAGNPLELAPQVALPCALEPNPVLIVLLPESSSAEAYYSMQGSSPAPATLTVSAGTGFCVSTQYSGECSAGDGLFGYWNTTGIGALTIQNASTSSEYFHYFSPGQYTLVTEDVWGQTTYAYFQVVAS